MTWTWRLIEIHFVPMVGKTCMHVVAAGRWLRGAREPRPWTGRRFPAVRSKEPPRRGRPPHQPPAGDKTTSFITRYAWEADQTCLPGGPSIEFTLFLTDFKKGGGSQFDWIFFLCLCYSISSPIVNRFWWFFFIGFGIVSDWYHINFGQVLMILLMTK